MKKSEFKKLNEGDIVILNGMCRQNAGIKCKVTSIHREDNDALSCIWVMPIDGEKFLGDWSIDPYLNEISYKAANII